MTKNRTYRVHGLDVWENETDGFEVNDVLPAFDTITFNDFDRKTDDQLIEQLLAAGILNGHPILDQNCFTVQESGDNNLFWINLTDNGRPVIELREIAD